MLKTLGKFLLTLVVVLAILAAGGWYVLTQTDLGRGAATDALWNSGIVTSQIESALRGNEDAIAARLGVSAEQVDAVIDGLDIDSWEAVQKPSGLAETDELSYDYGGTQVSATLYDDPGYVTVDVDGQEVTLKIPESASQYLQYLQ